MRYSLFKIIIILFLIIACNKPPHHGAENNAYFKASISSVLHNTKVNVEEDKDTQEINFMWETCDLATIYDSISGELVGNYVVSEVNQDNIATFEKAIESGLDLVEGREYIAVFPVSSENTLTLRDLESNDSQIQTSNASMSHISENLRMKTQSFAYSKDVAVNFIHEKAVLTVNFQTFNHLRPIKVVVKLYADDDIQKEYELEYTGEASEIYSAHLIIDPISICNSIKFEITQSDAEVKAISKEIDGGVIPGRRYVFNDHESINTNIDFPDKNFKKALLTVSDGDIINPHYSGNIPQKIDSNGDGEISYAEAAVVTQIKAELDDENLIKSLEGIRHFIMLEQLELFNQPVTEIDLSANINLLHYDGGNNKLENLDLSNNTKLEIVECEGGNTLKSLLLPDSEKLEVVKCSENQLSALDLSKNIRLVELDCSKNLLKKIDLSNNLGLKTLRCEFNELSKLDLSNCTKLSTLICEENVLESLILDNNNRLVTLQCGKNKIKELDLKNNINLTRIYCRENRLSFLDITRNSSVFNIECGAQKDENTYDKVMTLRISEAQSESNIVNLNSESNVVVEVEGKEFEKLTFTATLKDVTPVSITFSDITPSNNYTPYVYGLLEASEVSSLGNEQIMQYYIDKLSLENGYIKNVYNAQDIARFSNLKVNTEYLFVAFAYDGTSIMSDLFQKECKTAYSPPKKDIQGDIKILSTTSYLASFTISTDVGDYTGKYIIAPMTSEIWYEFYGNTIEIARELLKNKIGLIYDESLNNYPLIDRSIIYDDIEHIICVFGIKEDGTVDETMTPSVVFRSTLEAVIDPDLVIVAEPDLSRMPDVVVWFTPSNRQVVFYAAIGETRLVEGKSEEQLLMEIQNSSDYHIWIRPAGRGRSGVGHSNMMYDTNYSAISFGVDPDTKKPCTAIFREDFKTGPAPH